MAHLITMTKGHDKNCDEHACLMVSTYAHENLFNLNS